MHCWLTDNNGGVRWWCCLCDVDHRALPWFPAAVAAAAGDAAAAARAAGDVATHP